MTAGYRLADHVILEPLIGQYPAWWCNLAPGPASFHAARFQLPALRSYSRNPKLHLAAARDPKLAGGPFVDLTPEHLPRVQELLAVFEREMADSVAFAEAFTSTSAKLLAEARGGTLEPWYRDLPEALRGRVELVYDYYNRPSVRADEGLLYAGPLYKRGLQSIRLFELQEDAERRFYMSTPSLSHRGDVCELKLAMDDPRTGALLALDLSPKPLSEIREQLGGSCQGAPLEGLLSEGGPRTRDVFREARTRMRYFGHACVLLEREGVSILTDPFIDVRPRSAQSVARYSFDDLPPFIDYVLVTHIHSDHFALETLLRLRPRVGTLVVPPNRGLSLGDVSLRRIAEKIGYRNVMELDSFQEIAFEQGQIVAVPFLGEHGDLAHGGKVTYFVRLGGDTMLFDADAACLDEEVPHTIRRVLGEVHTVFMNTEVHGAPLSWPFDALFPREGRDKKLEDTRRARGSNADEGLRMVKALGGRRLYNYAMGLEPWIERITGPASTPESSRMRESARLLSEARLRGIEAELLFGRDERTLT